MNNSNTRRGHTQIDRLFPVPLAGKVCEVGIGDDCLFSTPPSTLRATSSAREEVNNGFTLIEMLVVVLIIGILAMVALPMYKHAILKGRFSTVMPMAKAVADAQEVYYLGNNQYALGKEDLDIAPVEAGNTQVALSSTEEEDEYIYVAANRTDIPNVRYIVYQKNSPRFASNIHCEAEANDNEAVWLCEKGLQGTEITGSLQGKNYKTFLLAGELGSSSFKVCQDNAVCDDEGSVTGCESGYYQEEQTCKQEKTCDEASKTIRTSCAEDCGEEIKEGTCNVKTGQWENYTVTQACPIKPIEIEPCEEGSDLKKTRSVSCDPTTKQWVVQGEWDTSGCKKECDPDTKPAESRSCQERGKCGLETRTVTCNYRTGEWTDLEWNTQGCSSSPESISQACDSPYTFGNKSSYYTCNSNKWIENWNYNYCGYACDNSNTAHTEKEYSCECGYRNIYYSCEITTGEWVSSEGPCPRKPAPRTIETGRGKISECDSGYGYYATTVYCEEGAWKQTTDYVAHCTDTEQEGCNHIGGCYWGTTQDGYGHIRKECICQSDWL